MAIYEYSNTTDIITNDETPFKKFIGIPRQLIIPERLGLTQITVIITTRSDIAWNMVQIALLEHPYIMNLFSYKKINNGLIARFMPPKDSLYLIIKFLNKLKILNLISKYNLIKSKGIRASIQPSLNDFGNPHFDYQEWSQSLDSLFQYKPKIEIPVNDLKNINNLQLEIIKFMCIETSLSLSSIRLQLGCTEKEMETEKSFIHDNLIYSENMPYSDYNSGKKHSYLIHIKEITYSEAISIYNLLSQNPLPFELTLEINHDNSILIWCELNFDTIINLIKYFWNKFNSVELITLADKFGDSIYLWIKPDNFDNKNKKWKIDEEFMIQQPFDNLIKNKIHWQKINN